MKFTDGFWGLREGVTAKFAEEAYDIETGPESIRVAAPTKTIATRGDTLNRPVLTVTITAPIANVVGVRVEHFQLPPLTPSFTLAQVTSSASVRAGASETSLESGALTATIHHGSPWNLEFSAGGEVLTRSGARSVAQMDVGGDTHISQQLALGVGELVYGLGERFGPFVKNGQTVDIWNADGGTSSEQAYKNIPFYLTNRGYGVLVNDPGRVSYEIGSEAVERVQFSVQGESLEYFVIYGPTPKQILDRFTELTGRPAAVPAWSYGLWLTTSFTTSYDEETVASFIDGMARRDLPLSVFHFDCFWMREFNWCDFEWDPRVFPDPEGMLTRLHGKDLRVCVWINPYIAQRSPLFAEAAEAGYLLKRPDGLVWQWDRWQAGMGLVDFSNPAATAWFQSKLRRLIDQGVDCFKTDFGERIPTDVEYFDGSSPQRMHNYYTLMYNRAVFDVLQGARGEGDAVVFARSATVGGQTMPVHWGGDSTSSFESMAETLRGGLSLSLSGFGFWSHDIGGFEGTPDAAVFKRWTAFGLLTSHSRFHGSDSYRVPWQFDDEAVEVTRTFTRLKLRLMPYLYAAGLEATAHGTPVMRPMVLEFPDDPAVAYLDTQYMLGPDLLVAPVFSAEGRVRFYLPRGTWTNYFTGERVDGPIWRDEVHGFESLPLYVREGAVLPIGAREDRPDYDYLVGLTLALYPGDHNDRSIRVTTPDGTSRDYRVSRTGDRLVVEASGFGGIQVSVIGGRLHQSATSKLEVTL